MNEIVVSEIQILPLKPNNGLIAFVSFVVNNQLYIGNVALYTSPSSSDGFRLVYPIKVLPNGKEISCVHPISREAGGQFQKAVIQKYEELFNKSAKQ